MREIFTGSTLMLSLLERLKQPGVLVADGAMGTMLFDRGLKPGECPEKLNLERPEVLEEIAGLYLKAGAEIIQTNTFGGSPLKLALYSLDNKTEEINASAIRAVRKIVEDRAFVSASCGPCGKILEPYGDAHEETVFDSFRRQMKTLIAEGVDMICVETMTDLAEATLAIKAAKSISPTIPVCATMTFDATTKGFFTIMGIGIEQAAKGLTDAGADIIGSNCGNGILNMIKIADEFKKYTTLPVIIQSNAGIPILKNGVSVFPETPEFMAEESRNLLQIGVKIIGGCCGTTPEHIAALRGLADQYQGLYRSPVSQ
jgi:5-methyltetrahydrofolate--homocysteine methyltransferase